MFATPQATCKFNNKNPNGLARAPKCVLRRSAEAFVEEGEAAGGVGAVGLHLAD